MSELLEIIADLTRKRLTRNQKRVLKRLQAVEDEATMSQLIRSLSIEFGLGQSTVRAILQTLRDTHLIACGNAEHKGISVQLTLIGEWVVQELS